jgi:hypothetical protein
MNSGKVICDLTWPGAFAIRPRSRRRRIVALAEQWRRPAPIPGGAGAVCVSVRCWWRLRTCMRSILGIVRHAERRPLVQISRRIAWLSVRHAEHDGKRPAANPARPRMGPAASRWPIAPRQAMVVSVHAEHDVPKPLRWGGLRLGPTLGWSLRKSGGHLLLGRPPPSGSR